MLQNYNLCCRFKSLLAVRFWDFLKQVRHKLSVQLYFFSNFFFSFLNERRKVFPSSGTKLLLIYFCFWIYFGYFRIAFVLFCFLPKFQGGGFVLISLVDTGFFNLLSDFFCEIQNFLFFLGGVLPYFFIF